MSQTRFGDIGVEFLVVFTENDNVIDVSSFSTFKIKFRKPSGTVATKTASFKTDGTDGQVTYTTVSGDLDEVGIWEIQGKADEINSEIEQFEVNETL